jgi:N-6 DNA Methylase
MSERSNLSALLERYGAPPSAVITFEDTPTPAHLRYLDLFSASLQSEVRPDAVVELHGSPVLYVARSRSVNFAPLRRAIALRGDGSFLGIIEPGRLTVHSVEIHGTDTLLYAVNEGSPTAAALIPTLALQPPAPAQTEAVEDLLFRLLDHATTELIDLGISPDDALSLAGRALFMRFLVDRGVMKAHEVAKVCPAAEKFEQCFATAESIAATSLWLDKTFNGNLLPLSASVNGDTPWFSRFPSAARRRVFTTLSTIMYRTETSGQMIMNWGDLDFAHVPVGLLSQVYERHSQRHHGGARTTSVHYTPRAIAEYMVNEAFSALPKPHTARVLDPAAGAGVFLVAAFRKLVEARWQHDTKRPTRRVIRSILNCQLAGFEINESALRLSALSLYLTALEVDPRPSPVEQLAFDDLRGAVLFDVSGDSGGTSPGSLGSRVGEEHNGRYDLVIGNPPWTAVSRDASSREQILTTLLPIVEERLGKARAAAFKVPDDVPDVAFFWRAMRWTRLSGQIALAMHGRLLFKQSAPGRQARADLFQAVRITGVLNGAAIRQTDVWPGVDAPFSLIFAKNERQQAADAFYYVSPEQEDALNRRGRIRIDAKAALVVRHSELLANPFVLKTLFRGTLLDQGVHAKIITAAPMTVAQYWRREKLASGLGYQVGGSAGKQQDASALHDLRELTRNRLTGFKIDTIELPLFQRETLLRPRRRAIYTAPLVVIAQSPNSERRAPRAAFASRDVVYDRAFFGFSCAGHSDGDELGRYLLVLFNSAIPLYTALLTSSQFGVERDTYLKEDVERQPIRPIDELSDAQRKCLRTLADGMLAGNPDWNAIDSWAAEIYGLNRWDREVIADTLATNAPFPATQAHAQQQPSRHRVDTFLARLASDLQPFVEPTLLRPRHGAPQGPWIWADLASESNGGPQLQRQDAVRLADDLGATQILVCSPGELTVATLAENRYWTDTRARLLALDLLQNPAALRAMSPHHGV